MHAAGESVDHWPNPPSARSSRGVCRGEVMPHWSCLPLPTHAFPLMQRGIDHWPIRHCISLQSGLQPSLFPEPG